MGKKIPKKLLPIVKALLATAGKRNVYYKRKYGFHRLVIDSVRFGHVIEWNPKYCTIPYMMAEASVFGFKVKSYKPNEIHCGPVGEI